MASKPYPKGANSAGAFRGAFEEDAWKGFYTSEILQRCAMETSGRDFAKKEDGLKYICVVVQFVKISKDYEITTSPVNASIKISTIWTLLKKL